jgi:hypothetical protein
MILLVVVEGLSDKCFFEYVFEHVLCETLETLRQREPKVEVKVREAKGIDEMLKRTLPDVCKVQNLYFKVIAIVDSDEMHKPFGKGTRISRLQEFLKSYKHLRVFPVRDNLEGLIQNCLPPQKRREFNDKIHARLKLAAAQWAIKQDLDVDTLKNKLVDLEGYLRCQQQKEI